MNDNKELGQQIWEQARARVEQQYPSASEEKKNAFANSVVGLVGRWSNVGRGGPSVREHAVGRTYGARQFPFEKACELLLSPDGLIFGPIRTIHRDAYEEEYCFQDDADDIKQLEDSE